MSADGREGAMKIAVRRGTTMLESDTRRRVEYRLAPPKYTERRRGRPGSGRKRSRANMLPRPSR